MISRPVLLTAVVCAMVFVTSRQFSAPACPPNEVLAVPPPTVRGVVHREDLIRALEQLAEETLSPTPTSAPSDSPWPSPSPVAPVVAPVVYDVSVGSGAQLSECKALWSKKVDDFVRTRQARRDMDAARPPINNAWVSARELLRLFFFDPYDPEWSCDTKRKIGIPRANGNDGPKWTCGVQLLKQPCVIISLGSSNVIDFESEMFKWGRCAIHVFDPTVDGSIAGELSRQAEASLHLVGLGDASKTVPMDINGRHVDAKLEPLAGLMRIANVPGNHLDVLKVDIEGFEWESMMGVFRDIASGSLSVGQVQLEMHINDYMQGVKSHVRLDDQPFALKTVRRFFEAADAAGLLLFSKEPNTAFCGGADCGEWAWVSADFALEEFINSHCPSQAASISQFERIPTLPFPAY